MLVVHPILILMPLLLCCSQYFPLTRPLLYLMSVLFLLHFLLLLPVTATFDTAVSIMVMYMIVYFVRYVQSNMMCYVGCARCCIAQTLESYTKALFLLLSQQYLYHFYNGYDVIAKLNYNADAYLSALSAMGDRTVNYMPTTTIDVVRYYTYHPSYAVATLLQ